MAPQSINQPMTPPFEMPQIMGILNVTPDSFSDGGELYKGNALDKSLVLHRVETMCTQGADFIDIGGESTRPNAQPVSIAEETDRVLPSMEWIYSNLGKVSISLDTSKPQLMQEAIKMARAYGTELAFINDVRALTSDGALNAAKNSQAAICLMHMRGEPQTMQSDLHYEDLLAEIKDYLSERLKACIDAGIAEHRIYLDPGIGFGKSAEQNWHLLNRLNELHELGQKLLLGASRKRFIGDLLNAENPKDRIVGSTTIAVYAAKCGVSVLRVHDVKETVDALRVALAISSQ